MYCQTRPKTQARFAVIVFAVLGIGGPGLQGASAQDEAPWLIMGASVSNLPREASTQFADYYEVYSDASREMPVIVQIGFYARPATAPIPVVLSGRRWTNELDIKIEVNDDIAEEYRLELLPNMEMALSPEQVRLGDWREARRMPANLLQGEGLQAFFAVRGPDGSKLVEGHYQIKVHWKVGAEDFFGMRTSPSRDVVFRVKRRHQEDDETGRYTEDLIERHYLWAVWLYKFDRQASRKEFEKAWTLVQEYLARGGGDEPELYNITPRYQAHLIAKWLDKNERAVSFLSQLLSTNRDPGECRMRYYHFGRERGEIPRNQAGDLALGLNRLYEQVYRKTMRGEPIESVPLRKHFPEEEDGGSSKRRQDDP